MTRKRRSLPYLAAVKGLPSPLLAQLDAEELEGQSIDFDTSLAIQLQLHRKCAVLRKERHKWEVVNGPVPDRPPFGLL